MRIMIIGGAIGMGLALAAIYARKGAQLALCGRDVGRQNDHPLRVNIDVDLYQFDIAHHAASTRAVQDFGVPGSYGPVGARP